MTQTIEIEPGKGGKGLAEAAEFMRLFQGVHCPKGLKDI